MCVCVHAVGGMHGWDRVQSSASGVVGGDGSISSSSGWLVEEPGVKDVWWVSMAKLERMRVAWREQRKLALRVARWWKVVVASVAMAWALE